MKRTIITLIRIYQKSFPIRYQIERNLHLPYHPCRFSPSCSEYTAQSITNHGVIKGVMMGVSQILKCQGFR